MSLNYMHVTAEQSWYKLEPFQAYSGVQGMTSKGKILDLKIPNE